MKRKKTRLEKWFSLNQHKRRKGGAQISDELATVDFDALKNSIIEGKSQNYTHGSAREVGEHLNDLKNEFIGQSELSYYHAKLIVLIRREIDTQQNFSRLEQLWSAETVFLLDELNTRWIVSAADTFADYSTDLLTRTFALNISSLVNSVKLCETERYINGSQSTTLNAEDSPVSLEKTRIGLWDGTSAFAVGTDDTLRNYRWRMEAMIDKAEDQCVTAPMLRKIFLRLQQHDTVYRRFKESHHSDRTRWW